jgi:hypothetical protein
MEPGYRAYCCLPHQRLSSDLVGIVGIELVSSCYGELHCVGYRMIPRASHDILIRKLCRKLSLTVASATWTAIALLGRPAVPEVRSIHRCAGHSFLGDLLLIVVYSNLCGDIDYRAFLQCPRFSPLQWPVLLGDLSLLAMNSNLPCHTPGRQLSSGWFTGCAVGG